LPARFYGLRQRGRIENADITIFNQETIACEPIEMRFDLPDGAGRIYAEATGIEHVIVNGVEIVRGREPTRRLPGTVLRSGRDT
jgi:hypothetical protein